jgi:predicted dehydrogenase
VHDLNRMRAAAAAAGVAIVSVHNWKNSEAYRSITAVIAAGRIGKIERVRFETWRDGCSASTGDNWRIDAAVAGGGILVDHGWHAFYLMMGLIGETPRSIAAHLENRRFVDAGVEDTVHCAIEFPTAQGEIMLTWAASERRTRWQVVGTLGDVEVEDDCFVVHSPSGDVRQTLTSGLTASSHHPDWFSAVVDELSAEIDEPQRRGRSLAEAEMCLRLLTQAYASARRGAQQLELHPEAIL